MKKRYISPAVSIEQTLRIGGIICASGSGGTKVGGNILQYTVPEGGDPAGAL